MSSATQFTLTFNSKWIVYYKGDKTITPEEPRGRQTLGETLSKNRHVQLHLTLKN